MNYTSFRKAQIASWKTLINCNISSLPIDLNQIMNHLGIKIHAYSKNPLVQLLKEDAKNGDGFIVHIEEEKHIFFNDLIKNKNRRRFTIAHEIGHSEMNHPLSVIHFRNSEIDFPDNPLELEANVFARDILAPACVLKELNIHTPEEIMRLCNISKTSAEIRAERMKKLYQKNKFYTDPLELQVKKQFENFIYQKQNNYSKNF